MQACRQHLPAPARQRIIQAALEYLEARTAVNMTPMSQSTSQPIQLSQGGVASTTAVRDASFQSHLMSLIDGDIPAHTLINACVKAADNHLLHVLVKCLCVIARLGQIRELKSVDGNLIVSQSQYQDHELLPSPVIDVDKQPKQDRQEQEIVASAQQHAAVGTHPPNNTAPNNVSIRRTGQNFTDEFVSKLVEGKRGASASPASQTGCSDVFNASVVREVPLSDHAKERIINLLANRMKSVDVIELPAFIYQLLLIASQKGKDLTKSRVLLNIAQVFSVHEERTRRADAHSQSLRAFDEDAIVASGMTMKELREIQGTALYHIDVAARQDSTLSEEVIRLTKSGVENPRHLLSSFGAGIVLSLARSALFRNDVLPLLREAVARFDKERALRISNLFAARVTMNDSELLDPRFSLLRIAESTCENGWDIVNEALLELAYVLMDKPLPLARTTTRQSLAKDLIVKLFTSHAVMRESILQNMQNRIAMQEKSALHAIRIIHTLSESIPSIMLEYQPFVRDCIELLPTLPEWLASPLMHCFKPFLELRQDLLDFLYLVIRKSLFYRESTTRAVAISGFLFLACIVKPGSNNRHLSQAMSQVSFSQQTGVISRIEAILETIQPLQRVFSYPPALRAFMYKNIINVVQSTGSEVQTRQLASAFNSILLSHVRRFIDLQKPPYLLLDHCVSESSGGAFQEPLGDLIWCLAVIESKRSPDKYKKSHIIDLSTKLASVSLQDFAVSKEPLDSPTDEAEDPEAFATAMANRNKVRVLGSVIEALVHAALIVPREHFNWRLVVDVIVPLLLFRGKVFELLKNAGLVSAGDTFRDLGGDLDLERLRPGARIIFQRTSKGGGAKKGGAKKRKPGNEQAGGAANVGQGSGGHRFGIFSVLTSAHMRPSLSLTASLDILDRMEKAMEDSSLDDNNPFVGQENCQDFQELRSYLISVAHKHLDDLIQAMSKWNLEEPEVRRVDRLEMACATEALVRIAMSDFKRYRRASGDVAHGGLRALQIGESCASALPLLCQHDDQIIGSFCRAILPSDASSVFDDEDDICETAATALEKLVENLLTEAMTKAAMTVLRIYGHLVNSIAQIKQSVQKRSSFLEKRSKWGFRMVVSKNIGDSTVVNTLTHLFLTYIENNNDMRRGSELCIRLLDVIGHCGNEHEPPANRENDQRKLVCALAVQQETSLAVVDAVCDCIERGLNDVEWCLGRMNCLETAYETHLNIDSVATEGRTTTASVSTEERKLQDQTAKQAIRAEDAAQTRLTGLILVLIELLKCAIAKWTQQERLLKFVSRTYRLLSMATQAQLKRRGDPRSTFVEMVNESKVLPQKLAMSYMFIDEASNDGSKSADLNAAKARSEGRIKAQVVYDEERYHQLLIAAEKKCRANLLRGMKRNAARDFRIREDKLRVDEEEADDAGQEEAEVEEGRDEAGEEGGADDGYGGEGEQENERASKRRKKTGATKGGRRR